MPPSSLPFHAASNPSDSSTAPLEKHHGWQPSQAYERRRRRRGPQVRQDRERRNESIARSAPCRALAPLPPRGHDQDRCGHAGWEGYAIGGAGNAVGIDVGNAVGVAVPESGRVRSVDRWAAGLRSLLAKQHAPKARPSPATDRGRPAGSRAGGQARMAPASTCAVAGSRTVALDRRASLPHLHHHAILVASTPGGDIPRSSLSTGRRLLLLPVSSKGGWSSRSPCGLGRLPTAG